MRHQIRGSQNQHHARQNGGTSHTQLHQSAVIFSVLIREAIALFDDTKILILTLESSRASRDCHFHHKKLALAL